MFANQHYRHKAQLCRVTAVDENIKMFHTNSSSSCQPAGYDRRNHVITRVRGPHPLGMMNVSIHAVSPTDIFSVWTQVWLKITALKTFLYSQIEFDLILIEYVFMNRK